MLLLTRKKGEKIILDDGDKIIEVIYVDTHQGRAEIGIQAPSSVKIAREELLKRGDNYGNR